VRVREELMQIAMSIARIYEGDFFIAALSKSKNIVHTLNVIFVLFLIKQ
jgi:hypothetical protein